MSVEVRLFAAKATLPYCTPRLAAVKVSENEGKRTHEEWCNFLANCLADHS